MIIKQSQINLQLWYTNMKNVFVDILSKTIKIRKMGNAMFIRLATSSGDVM